MSLLKKCVTSGVLQTLFVIAFSVALLASHSESSAQSKSTSIEVSGAVVQPTVNSLGGSLAAETSTTPSESTSDRVINCSGFAASGACGVSVDGYSTNAFIVTHSPTAALVGSQVNIIPTGSVHYGSGLISQKAVNVQAFSSTYTFIPNGWNLAFVLQNNTNTNASPAGPLFGAGAGCEAGFYQAFDSNDTPPNNIFALELDQQSDLVNDNGAGYGSPFTYSSVQIYKAAQSPCNPNDNQSNYYYTQKISTSPVPLNSPVSSIGTITGDTYSVTLNYDGTNLVMDMYDVTAGASCPGSRCFTQTWSSVNIPALVGGNTAYVGLTGGTNEASNYPLYVKSLVYTVLSPTSTPTFSPVAGNYSASQSVTISDSTSGATIYYTTNGTTPTASSIQYSGPITVSSTDTLKAVATAGDPTASAIASATYVIGSSYIDYPKGGFQASSFDLNGGAAITSGGLLQLTDGGRWEDRSTWFATEVPVKTFATDFTFQQLNASADGITFSIQGQGSAALGGMGGSLGYGGITNSVAVKFDLHNNDGEGDDSTGLYTDGAQPTVPSIDLSSTAINLHSGDVMHAHMVYDGTNLTMTLTDTVSSGSVTEVFPLNIPGLVGGDKAYVGFTGGTGSDTSTQNVLSWTFSTP